MPAAVPVPPRTQGTRSVLAIGLDRDEFARFAPFLDRDSFEVDRFPRLRLALPLVSAIGFDLLLLRYPSRDMDCAAFVAAVRAGDCRSRRAALVLLSPAAARAAAEVLLGRGANHVLALDAPDQAEVQRALAHLLGVAPRKATRVPTRLEVRLPGRSGFTLGVTVNISATGMLVETDRRMSRGERVEFEFNLDHRPVRGVAEVVRCASPAREGLAGYGFRFLSFGEGARERFERVLGRL